MPFAEGKSVWSFSSLNIQPTCIFSTDTKSDFCHHYAFPSTKQLNKLQIQHSVKEKHPKFLLQKQTSFQDAKIWVQTLVLQNEIWNSWGFQTRHTPVIGLPFMLQYVWQIWVIQRFYTFVFIFLLSAAKLIFRGKHYWLTHNWATGKSPLSLSNKCICISIHSIFHAW